MWTTCPSAGADGRFLVGLSHGLLRSGGSLSSRAAGTPIFRRPMPCAPFAAVQERGSFYFAGLVPEHRGALPDKRAGGGTSSVTCGGILEMTCGECAGRKSLSRRRLQIADAAQVGLVSF